MIELKRNQLVISFPDVHPDAKMSIDFQRTLRIPDDGSDHPLPPGLGRFSLRHVDDYAAELPPGWLEHGGIMLPMYQSEAMWLNFIGCFSRKHHVEYPFAIKVAAGKINAVTGEAWLNGIHQEPQDYVVVPEQPWLDGFCVEKGIIRQFVAMPLGSGYSAEEQLTGAAEFGGLQIVACPMKREAFERHFSRFDGRSQLAERSASFDYLCSSDMGLAPGGRMRQVISEDPFKLDDWDTDNSSRCFVHICNSMVWRSATGEQPPTAPPTAKAYTEAGLPWFEYYAEDQKALPGGSRLKNLKSIVQLAGEKGDNPLPENASVNPKNVKVLRKGLKKNEVRNGTF